MATIFLRGGLGNQMFQYAAGLRLARHTKTPLIIDTTFLNDHLPRPGFTHRDYDLDIFSLAPSFTGLSKISRAIPIPGVWLGIDLAMMWKSNILGVKKIIKEKKDYVFDPAVWNAQGSSVLMGFWQSEKYFADILDEVRSEFTFRHPLEGEAKMIAEKTQSVESVSLHVRRTDYMNKTNFGALGSVTDIDYYKAAIAAMSARLSHPHFFIFSDDIEWCKKNITGEFSATFLGDDTAGPKASWHLELMSLCKNNIIANSSFSWWGAWLNNNPKKIVIAPKRWAGDSKDIIPTSWKTV